MKKLYFAAITLILLISASLFAYGIFLNVASEKHITAVLEQRAVSLKGARAAYRNIRPEIYLDTAGFDTAGMMDAMAKIDGTVKDVYVRKGDTVKKGDSLCRIENDELQLRIAKAETDITRAEALYIKYRSDFVRNKKLLAEDVISQSDYETSEQQERAAAAELSAAKIVRKQLLDRTKYMILRAPIDGTVTSVYKTSGSRVVDGTSIMNIADFTTMGFSALIDEYKFQNLMPMDEEYDCLIMDTEIKQRVFDIAISEGVSKSNSFDISILKTTPEGDKKSLIREVTWEIKNPHGIIEIGMYTDVLIRKKRPVRVLTVPIDAIRDRGVRGVYVVSENGTLAFRPVETGFYDNEYIETRSGLKDGEMVVVSKVDQLPLGTNILITSEGEGE